MLLCTFENMSVLVKMYSMWEAMPLLWHFEAEQLMLFNCMTHNVYRGLARLEINVTIFWALQVERDDFFHCVITLLCHYASLGVLTKFKCT